MRIRFLSLTHLKLLSVIILTLLTDRGLSASSFDDTIHKTAKQNLKLDFAALLVPAELRFAKYCKEQEIDVKWEKARKAFYLNAERGRDIFKGVVRDWLYINYEEIDKLGVDDLYQQYLDLYLALNPQPESPIDQPEEKIQSSVSNVSPSSSTVISDPQSDDENEYQDDDTDDGQSSGTVTPPPSSTLRRRHSPPHS